MGSARITMIAIASLGTLMGVCSEEAREPAATTTSDAALSAPEVKPGVHGTR